MKLLFNLLLLFGLHFVLNAKTTVSDNPYLMMYLELLEQDPPSTPADETRIACFAWYCHFEDRGECRSDCKKRGELRVDLKWEDAVIGYIGDDVNLCKADCLRGMQKGSESEKVCANLCEMETSNRNREKWAKWWKELVEEINLSRRGKQG